MKSASFILQGNKDLGYSTSRVLRDVFTLFDWKHVITYELDGAETKRINESIGVMREAWWPVARRLLMQCGKLDLEELEHLRSAIEVVNCEMRAAFEPAMLEKLFDRVDAYYVCGTLPVEWLSLDGLPLCLYAPFYRFATPDDILSQYTPHAKDSKIVIAPQYSKPGLAGINAASKGTAILGTNRPGVTLLDGNVDAGSLLGFRDRQFARLLFNGHATADGVLASDGTLLSYESVLRLVQGPAFLFGCSTGAFELGTLQTIMQRIPKGLHGALLTAFPVSGDYCTEMNLMAWGTFLEGDARRIQDIAHMMRLALAWIGGLHAIARLNNVPAYSGVAIVTPFEADYEAYAGWGAGVAKMQKEMKSSVHMTETIFSVAVAFAMAIVSCGTPFFLLPEVDQA
jgi:hypothetical protein